MWDFLPPVPAFTQYYRDVARGQAGTFKFFRVPLMALPPCRPMKNRQPTVNGSFSAALIWHSATRAPRGGQARAKAVSMSLMFKFCWAFPGEHNRPMSIIGLRCCSFRLNATAKTAAYASVADLMHILPQLVISRLLCADSPVTWRFFYSLCGRWASTTEGDHF